MSNNSNNEELTIFGFFILVFLGIVAWFAKQFGLDFTTGMEVVTRFILLVSSI